MISQYFQIISCDHKVAVIFAGVNGLFCIYLERYKFFLWCFHFQMHSLTNPTDSLASNWCSPVTSSVSALAYQTSTNHFNPHGYGDVTKSTLHPYNSHIASGKQFNLVKLQRSNYWNWSRIFSYSNSYSNSKWKYKRIFLKLLFKSKV